MRKTRGGWGETAIFPAATAPFPKSRESYLRFAPFKMSQLHYLRAWHRLKNMNSLTHLQTVANIEWVIDLKGEGVDVKRISCPTYPFVNPSI